MKKLLYTTSALVGAAFLMEAVVPAKAEVNMSLRYRAALISQSKKDEDKKRTGLDTLANKGVSGDNGDKKHRSTSLRSSKINIDISASKDHPNGLTTGASLAAATGDKKLDYDNAIGYISGSFGKLEVGDFHDVGYRALGYGTPGTSNFGAIDAGFQPSGGYVNTSATGNIGGRSSSIAYWSPSFSGAQVSVSWSPQVSKEGKQASFVSAQGDLEDSVGFAATYSGSFGGTGVSMGVSFENAKTVNRTVDVFEIKGYAAAASAGGREVLAVRNYDSPFTLVKDNTVLTPDKTYVTGGKTVKVKKANQDPTAFAGYISFDIGQFSVGGSYGAWEKEAVNSAKISEATAFALGASYSVDAMTFGVGYGTQTTETVNHDVRVSATGANALTDTPTIAQIDASTPYKSSLDNDILAFTVGYSLGDGAAIDFVIEQSSAEELATNLGGDGDGFGKREVKSSGFGVGIDLKF